MKSIFQKSKYFTIFLVGFATIIIVSAQIARANDDVFQNNLLKVDVHKTSQGDVKVTLYTTKPYNESISVNQKGNNEYVILLPETSNSLTAKPSLKSADVVKNVEVKTQQYTVNQGQKGYTKITFSTQSPVEIIPQTQTLSASENPINEQDFKELMSQTVKKPAQTLVIPSKRIAPPRPTLTKERVVKFPARKKTVQIKPTVLAATKPQKAHVAPKVALQKVQTPVAKTPKVEIPTAEAPIKAEKAPEQIQPATQAPAQTAQNPAPMPTPVATSPQPVPTYNPATIPAELPQAPQGRLETYKVFVQTHVLEVLAGLLIPAILIMLLLRGARKTISSFNEQKETFTTHLDEQPGPIKDYTEIINEDMNWKEKYKTFVEAENEPQIPQEEQPQAKSDLDSLFLDESLDEAPVSEPKISDFEPTNETGDIAEIDSWGDAGFESLGLDATFSQKEENEISLDDLFKEEFEQEAETISFVEPEIAPKEVFHTEPQEEFKEESPEIVEAISFVEPEPVIVQPTARPAEPQSVVDEEIISSKVDIESGKGFYLLDYEGITVLAGNIGEEIFVLKKFDKIVKGKLQARLSENKGFTNDYLVRLDSYKAMVEVSQDRMNLLIEL